MKRQSVAILAMFLLACLAFVALVACDDNDNKHVYGEWLFDETYHWQQCTVKGHTDTTEKQQHTYVAGAKKTCSVCGKTVDYTDEQNLQEFLAACDFTYNYEGAYKTTLDISESNGEERMNITETWDGNYKLYGYCKQEDDTANEESFTVVEPSKLKDTDIDCLKVFVKICADNGGGDPEESSYASYYNPEQIANQKQYTPYISVAIIYDGDCETLDDIKNLVTKHFSDVDAFTIDKFEIVRNADGSVSLKGEFNYNEAEGNSEGNSTIYNTSQTIEIVAADGKIVKSICNATMKLYINDKLDSTSESIESGTFAYEFDEDLFKSVDTTTDVVTNEYYCGVEVYLQGYNEHYLYFDYIYGGDKIAIDELTDTIFGKSFWTNIRKTDVEYAFFEDADLTKAASAEYVANQHTLKLYLSVTPKSGKAIVVCAFRESSNDSYYTQLRTAYLYDVGDRVFPRSHFTTNPILTVNGQPAEGCTSFVCTESKLYSVMYDGTTTISCELTHDKFVDEWSFNAESHWQVCDDCGLVNGNFGMHTFAEKDGKSVCSVCGYPEGGTEAELYAKWTEALQALFLVQQNKLFTYKLDNIDSSSNGTSSQQTIVQSRDGERYFLDKSNYQFANGGWQEIRRELVACQPYGSAGYLQVFSKVNNHGAVNVKGSYKPAGYTADNLQMQDNIFYNTGFEIFLNVKSGTLDDFVNAVKQAMTEFNASGRGTEDEESTSDVVFICNSDGSVTMRFIESGKYKLDRIKTEGYIHDVYQSTYDITAKDGKIVSFVCDYSDGRVFENENNNTESQGNITITVGYEFDKSAFNAIDFSEATYVSE